MTLADALYHALTQHYGVPERNVIVRNAPEGARVETTHQAMPDVRDALDRLEIEYEPRGMSYPTTFSVATGGDLDR